MALLQTTLLILSLPAVALTAYLGLLAAASLGQRRPRTASRSLRFDVVVPAHDEEAGIGRTVESLRRLDWPADRFRVVVVADNCSDATAARAAAAGAHVLERRDSRRRGKGYALDFAFQQILAERSADAVVVVDADTVVTPNLLAAFAARLEGGALAAQAEYGVLNAGDSWRTRLMTIAFALFHDVRSRGRERLGVSCGLRGNGMCFAAAALARVPHAAFSLVEDVEYGIRLGEAGIRVHYAGEARVLGDMVSGGAASRSQRSRWEGGRLALLREHGARLLQAAWHRRDAVLADLAMDVIVPPLSWVALYVGAGALLATAALGLFGGSLAAVVPWVLCCGLLGLYLARGLWLSGTGLRGLATLCWAPLYVAWKVALALRGSVRAARPEGAEWIRTTRETRSALTK